MARKEFVRLIEENMTIMDRLMDRTKAQSMRNAEYTRSQISVLVRLHLGGRALLKDIAYREYTTTPNLCATFKILESRGLVLREVDEKDRRNTWYSVTPAGAAVAKKMIVEFENTIGQVFAGLSREDEEELVAAMATINKVLSGMEVA
ncbi:MAG: MarR family transcriptional regulator [Alphaproteobacteria bacterium]|nr:MarR family transcriptional regulator [Alphaproteobacteria bacterium]